LVVGDKQKANRIDAYIAGNHKNYTRSKLKALSEAGRLLVNGSPVKASYMVKPNDAISILTPYATQADKLAPQKIPIDCYQQKGRHCCSSRIGRL
jgi:23S rRNA pseudouridine1911/1915/1917 synthase